MLLAWNLTHDTTSKAALSSLDQGFWWVCIRFESVVGAAIVPSCFPLMMAMSKKFHANDRAKSLPPTCHSCMALE